MRTNRNVPGTPVPRVQSERRGMTLIEVILAISLLTGALLSMGAFVASFATVTGNAAVRGEANELVADRLEEVKGALKYATLESNYAKSEAAIANHPGFARQTIITHTGGNPQAVYDYKTVTVIVTNPVLKKPAKKTTVISVF